jgi:hypothetical protein
MSTAAPAAGACPGDVAVGDGPDPRAVQQRVACAWVGGEGGPAARPLHEKQRRRIR